MCYSRRGLTYFYSSLQLGYYFCCLIVSALLWIWLLINFLLVVRALWHFLLIVISFQMIASHSSFLIYSTKSYMILNKRWEMTSFMKIGRWGNNIMFTVTYIMMVIMKIAVSIRKTIGIHWMSSHCYNFLESLGIRLASVYRNCSPCY